VRREKKCEKKPRIKDGKGVHTVYSFLFIGEYESTE